MDVPERRKLAGRKRSGNAHGRGKLVAPPHDRAPGAAGAAGRPGDPPKPPSAIPVNLNSQYFSLSPSGVAWEAIGRARNLAAYVPGDFPNPQLELVVPLPEMM